MNKTQRKQLADICERLSNLAGEVQAIGDEEQEKWENMPENLQSSDRGEKFIQAADGLGAAGDELTNICMDIEEVLNDGC